PALLQVANRLAPDVGLGDLPHFDGALHPGADAPLLERILHGERIDHRRQHPHVVGARAIHPLGRPGDAAEDVASPDHDGDLDAEAMDLGHLRGDLVEGTGIDSVFAVAHEGFAGELEEDPLIFRLGHRATAVDPCRITGLRGFVACALRAVKDAGSAPLARQGNPWQAKRKGGSEVAHGPRFAERVLLPPTLPNVAKAPSGSEVRSYELSAGD